MGPNSEQNQWNCTKNFTCVLLLQNPPFSFLFLFFIFENFFPLPHIALNSYLAYEIPMCSSCTAVISLMCPLSWTTFQAKLAGQTNPYNDCLVFLFSSFFLFSFFFSYGEMLGSHFLFVGIFLAIDFLASKLMFFSCFFLVGFDMLFTSLF